MVFSLVDYAAWRWVDHAKSEDVLSQIDDMVKRLFDPRNPHFEAWISISNMDYRYDPHFVPRPTPLYYAALLNLRGVAGDLLK